MSESPAQPLSASTAANADCAGLAIDFEFVWREGSVPPPDHYWFRVTGSTAGRGQIEFVPGYAFEAPPRWVEAFTIESAQAAQLQALVQHLRAMDRDWPEAPGEAVGGSQRSIHLRRGARAVDVPNQLCASDAALADALEAALRALVPEAVWASIRQRHADYVESRSR